MTETETDSLITTAQELLSARLMARTWGNLSRRLSPESYLITPSGRDYNEMTPHDLVEVTFDGDWIDDLKLSGKRGLHTTIYHERGDAKFIIHTHQPYASALSLGGGLNLPSDLAARMGSLVLPAAEYGLPSTRKLHQAVADAIWHTDSRATLMRAHGAVLFGGDPEELVDLTQSLEVFCAEVVTDLTGVETCGLVRRFVRDGFGLPLQVIHVFMRREDTGAVIGDDSPLLLEFRETGLPAYLGDYVQLIGLRVGKTFGTNLILGRKVTYFLGADLAEAKVAREVSRKNALAAKVAASLGASPLPRLDSIIMRAVYRWKYSKLKDGGQFWTPARGI